MKGTGIGSSPGVLGVRVFFCYLKGVLEVLKHTLHARLLLYAPQPHNKRIVIAGYDPQSRAIIMYWL